MYEKGYNRIFWGFIFTIININIIFIDILPNFIGYLLILSGLGIIEDQHPIYKKGKLPAFILFIISLKDLFALNQSNNFTMQINSKNLWMTMIFFISILIDIYLTYIICKGIYLISMEEGLIDLRDNSKGNFTLFLIINILIVFAWPFSLNIQSNGPMAAIILILTLVSLFANIGIVLVIRRGRELLKN